MRVISICLFGLLVFSNPGYAIELGYDLPEGSYSIGSQLVEFSKIEKNGNTYTILTRISKTYEVEENGVNYQVTLDQNYKIKSISTLSNSVITPEGIHVGNTYDDVRSITMEPMKSEQGWGHFIRLPSGWMAGFCIGDVCNKRPKLKYKTVGWLFKRQKCSIDPPLKKRSKGYSRLGPFPSPAPLPHNAQPPIK